MTARSARDRAAMWFGVVSVLSVPAAHAADRYRFVDINGAAAVVVALVLGALAFVAGWFGQRLLTLATGAGFLLAALVLLALMSWGTGGFLHGTGSTFALWLGLGAGLLALALTPRTAGSPID